MGLQTSLYVIFDVRNILKKIFVVLYNSNTKVYYNFRLS